MYASYRRPVRGALLILIFVLHVLPRTFLELAPCCPVGTSSALMVLHTSAQKTAPLAVVLSNPYATIETPPIVHCPTIELCILDTDVLLKTNERATTRLVRTVLALFCTRVEHEMII